MHTKQKAATFFAVLAAALYAISVPTSKLLLEYFSPTIMAAYLYLGAGLGMLAVSPLRNRLNKGKQELRLTGQELPYTLGMIVLDIIAPIFLMLGLTMATAANASLLNNFEIVATSLIALLVFKEAISKRLWFAIFLITASSIILSFENVSSLAFSWGSLLVLLACICWGLENNCTRKLSVKDPLQIVVIKGICSGTGALLIGLFLGDGFGPAAYIFVALLLGFVAFGLSIFFYVYAQRELGAAKTSAYYAISPFIGVALSLLIFKTLPGASFLVALVIMIAGTYFAATDYA